MNYPADPLRCCGKKKKKKSQMILETENNAEKLRMAQRKQQN